MYFDALYMRSILVYYIFSLNSYKGFCYECFKLSIE